MKPINFIVSFSILYQYVSSESLSSNSAALELVNLLQLAIDIEFLFNQISHGFYSFDDARAVSYRYTVVFSNVT
jgi:hypothetical protein